MKRLIVFIFAALFAFYVAWPGYSGYQIHQALQAQDSPALANKIDFPSVRDSMKGPVMAHIEQRMSALTSGSGALLGKITDLKFPQQQVEGIVDAALLDVVNPDSLGRIYATGGDIGAEMKRSILKQIDKMGGFMALFKGAGGSNNNSTETAGETGGDSSGGGGLGGIKLPGAIGDLLGSDAGKGVAGKLAGDVAGAIADKIGGMDAGKIAEMLFPKLEGGSAQPLGPGSSGEGGGGMPSFGLDHVKSFGFAGPLGLQLGVARSTSATEPDVTAQINFQDLDWKVTKLIPNL